MPKSTTTLVFILLVALCASCSNDKELQQTEIAINATTPTIGITAVAGVNTESLLGKITLEATTQEAAAAALKKLKKLITQQEWLGDAATKATQANIRLFAVEKLDDQVTLTYVAKNDTAIDVLGAAVKKLTDKNLLADVARNAKDWRVRAYAAGSIDDQMVLSYIAQHDESDGVRLAAVDRLDDQKILANIAKNDKLYDVRLLAIHRLTDQAALADLALNNTATAGLRFSAASKQQVLADASMLETATDTAIRKLCYSAVFRLTDQKLWFFVDYCGS